MYKCIYYKGELTNYGINKKGHVKNLITNTKLKARINKAGYFVVRLTIDKYTRKEFFVHKLLAEAFIPNDDPVNKTDIHHMDYDKLNNKLDNLLWISSSDHARLHIYKRRDSEISNSKTGKLNKKQVHLICSYFENNKYTQSEISEMFNITFQSVHNILLRKSWTDISEMYDFSNYTKYDWVTTDKDTIINICKDIISNNYKTFKEIAIKNNVNESVISDIYYGRSFKDITSQYDFSLATKLRCKNRNRELNKNINKLIHEGYTNEEIINKLNLIRTPAITTRLYRIRHKLIQNI